MCANEFMRVDIAEIVGSGLDDAAKDSYLLDLCKFISNRPTLSQDYCLFQISRIVEYLPYGREVEGHCSISGLINIIYCLIDNSFDPLSKTTIERARPVIENIFAHINICNKIKKNHYNSHFMNCNLVLLLKIFTKINKNHIAEKLFIDSKLLGFNASDFIDAIITLLSNADCYLHDVYESTTYFANFYSENNTVLSMNVTLSYFLDQAFRMILVDNERNDIIFNLIMNLSSKEYITDTLFHLFSPSVEIDRGTYEKVINKHVDHVLRLFNDDKMDKRYLEDICFNLAMIERNSNYLFDHVILYRLINVLVHFIRNSDCALLKSECLKILNTIEYVIDEDLALLLFNSHLHSNNHIFCKAIYDILVKNKDVTKNILPSVIDDVRHHGSNSKFFFALVCVIKDPNLNKLVINSLLEASKLYTKRNQRNTSMCIQCVANEYSYPLQSVDNSKVTFDEKRRIYSFSFRPQTFQRSLRSRLRIAGPIDIYANDSNGVLTLVKRLYSVREADYIPVVPILTDVICIRANSQYIMDLKYDDIDYPKIENYKMLKHAIDYKENYVKKKKGKSCYKSYLNLISERISEYTNIQYQKPDSLCYSCLKEYYKLGNEFLEDISYEVDNELLCKYILDYYENYCVFGVNAPDNVLKRIACPYGYHLIVNQVPSVQILDSIAKKANDINVFKFLLDISQELLGNKQIEPRSKIRIILSYVKNLDMSLFICYGAFKNDIKERYNKICSIFSDLVNLCIEHDIRLNNVLISSFFSVAPIRKSIIRFLLSKVEHDAVCNIFDIAFDFFNRNRSAFFTVLAFFFEDFLDITEKLIMARSYNFARLFFGGIYDVFMHDSEFLLFIYQKKRACIDKLFKIYTQIISDFENKPKVRAYLRSIFYFVRTTIPDSFSFIRNSVTKVMDIYRASPENPIYYMLLVEFLEEFLYHCYSIKLNISTKEDQQKTIHEEIVDSRATFSLVRRAATEELFTRGFLTNDSYIFIVVNNKVVREETLVTDVAKYLCRGGNVINAEVRLTDPQIDYFTPAKHQTVDYSEILISENVFEMLFHILQKSDDLTIIYKVVKIINSTVSSGSAMARIDIDKHIDRIFDLIKSIYERREYYCLNELVILFTNMIEDRGGVLKDPTSVVDFVYDMIQQCSERPREFCYKLIDIIISISKFDHTHAYRVAEQLLDHTLVLLIRDTDDEEQNIFIDFHDYDHLDIITYFLMSSTKLEDKNECRVMFFDSYIERAMDALFYYFSYEDGSLILCDSCDEIPLIPYLLKFIGSVCYKYQPALEYLIRDDFKVIKIFDRLRTVTSKFSIGTWAGVVLDMFYKFPEVKAYLDKLNEERIKNYKHRSDNSKGRVLGSIRKSMSNFFSDIDCLTDQDELECCICKCPPVENLCYAFYSFLDEMNTTIGTAFYPVHIDCHKRYENIDVPSNFLLCMPTKGVTMFELCQQIEVGYSFISTCILNHITRIASGSHIPYEKGSGSPERDFQLTPILIMYGKVMSGDTPLSASNFSEILLTFNKSDWLDQRERIFEKYVEEQGTSLLLYKIFVLVNIIMENIYLDDPTDTQYLYNEISLRPRALLQKWRDLFHQYEKTVVNIRSIKDVNRYCGTNIPE